MESIIEFIFANFVFVAVIIGGLLSLFSRMANSGQQQEQQQRRQQHPGQNQEKVDWREIFRQEEGESGPSQPRQPTYVGPRQSEGARSTTSPTASQVESGMNDLLNEQQLQNHYEEARRRKEKVARRTREQVNEHDRTGGSLDLHLNRLSNKEAMKAVVWAEVLGRPRARQPHNTFARKR